jgi:hypothetical protein
VKFNKTHAGRYYKKKDVIKLRKDRDQHRKDLQKGIKNPAYDDTEHNFVHQNGEKFVGPQVEFRKKYNLDRGPVSKLIKKKAKTHKGWQLG